MGWCKLRHHWTLTCVFLILTLFTTSTKAASNQNASDSPFAFKTMVIGVYVETDDMRGVDGIKSKESNFRDIIFTTLLAGERSNETDKQVANITLVPLDIKFEPEKIPSINGLITVTTCQATLDLNEKVTEHYGMIFHIAVTEPGCTRIKSTSAITVPLSMFRHRDEVLQLLVDIRHRDLLIGWEKAIIIHDKFTGADILNSVEDAFSKKLAVGGPAIETLLWSVDSRHTHKSLELQMEDLFQSFVLKDIKFVVITPVANIESTLAIAKRMHLLKSSTQWLFLAPDSASKAYNRWDYVRDKIIDEGVHVAFVSNRTQGIGTYAQLFCTFEQLLTILVETIEELASDEFEKYTGISDDEWENIKNTREEAVEMIIMNTTSSLDEAIQNVCENSYIPNWILEAGEHGVEGKQVFQIGSWQPFAGLDLSDALFPHIVGKFRGRRIKVASMHFPPWQIFTRNASTGKTMYSGLMFEILDHMKTSLNFTYEVVEPSDGGGWGTEGFDGSWNGMMKQVINEEVILGAAAFTIRPEKAKVVNFTTIIEREAYTFMVNRPSELSRILLFAEPFRLEVWLSIAVCTFFVGVIFYFLHAYSPYYEAHNLKHKFGLFNVKNCLLYVYGALLQQGGSRLPDAHSGRMLIGFWWVFVLVVITTYSGNLVAFLTFPRVELPVNSFKDLVNRRGAESWGFLAGSVIESYIKVSNESDIIKLSREAIKHPTMNDSVLNKIRFQEHAYIDWKISLLTIMKETYLTSGKCEFVLGEEEIFQEQIAMIVPRSSPYLTLFDEEIKTMLRSGMMIKWRDKYWPKKDKCSSKIAKAAANRTVKLGDMQGSFYILLVGTFVSLSVLLIEYLWHRRQQSKVMDTIKTIVSHNAVTEYLYDKQLPFLH